MYKLNLASSQRYIPLCDHVLTSGEVPWSQRIFMRTQMMISSSIEQIGVIYLATNLINGKIYIGLSKCGLKKRKNEHLNAAINGSNYPFHCAIRKYGVGNFRWSVIKQCLIEDLARIEMSSIEQYKSAGYTLYNLTEGGEGCLNPSDETRAKLSASGKIAQNRPEVVTKRVATLKQTLARPEIKARRSRASLEVHSRPEVKDKLKAISDQRWARPGAKKEYGATMRVVLARPDIKEKMRATHRGENNNKAKVTEQQVMEMRHLYEEGQRLTELAQRYELGVLAVRRIINRQTWKHVL